MNKAAIVARIIDQLDAELERFARAADDAQAGATDEQSKAENKYDTRGLEASYLAHGQSRQAAETAYARQQLAAMSVRNFAADEAIELGALVELEAAGECSWYLVAPAGGGREVLCEVEITVVTPASALGSQLIGKRIGGNSQGHRILRLV